MKIVHISNTDSGGAVELHQAMLEKGFESVMLIKHEDAGTTGNIVKIPRFNVVRSALGHLIMQKLLSKKPGESRMFTIPFIGSKVAGNRFLWEADAIYLHFIAQGNMLSFSELAKILKLGKPTFFITRDYWPVTGGCHTPLDCNKYLDLCYDCPILEKIYFFDLVRIQYKCKQKLYSKYKNLHFIALSQNNYNNITRSKIIAENKKYLISNCIDTNIFRPFDKSEARKILGIKPTGLIFGFGARDLSNPFKGMNILNDALKIIGKRTSSDFLLLTFGKNGIKANEYKIKNLGFLKDKYSLTLFYNAIDIYINPSLSETFGNTTLEVLACGIPVVGFNTGGLADIIDHKKTGYIAEANNTFDLVQGILETISLLKQENIKQVCRDKVLSNFSREKILNEHIKILKEVL